MRYANIVLLLACVSCASLDRTPAVNGGPAASASWCGVYASPGEIGMFAGAVLLLAQRDPFGDSDELQFRMRSYSDFEMPNRRKQDERRGSCRIVGNIIIFALAEESTDQDEPGLYSETERMFRLTINGHTVLMRQDAYEAYVKENKLYDYGVLVRVDDQADWFRDLREVRTPSIKLLYADPTKPWRDPWINGPNER